MKKKLTSFKKFYWINGKTMYKIYSSLNCVYCELAKGLLSENNIKYKEIVLDTREKRQSFRDEGFKTVPQIYDDEGNHIGGWDDLKKKMQ